MRDWGTILRGTGKPEFLFYDEWVYWMYRPLPRGWIILDVPKHWKLPKQEGV